MKKKILSAILAALILLSSAACTRGENDSTTDSSTEEITTIIDAESVTEKPTEALTEVDTTVTDTETTAEETTEVPTEVDTTVTDTETTAEKTTEAPTEVDTTVTETETTAEETSEVDTTVTDTETTVEETTEAPTDADTTVTDAEITTEEITESPTEVDTTVTDTETTTEEITEESTEVDTTVTDTETITENPTEVATEETTEPETDTPINITVPDYEDIGIIDKLVGKDNRANMYYDFSKSSYKILQNDSKLVFTSNLAYTSTDEGWSITTEGWNSVGFAHSPTSEYTAKVAFTNRSVVSDVRSVLFGVRVTRNNHLHIDSGLWFTFSGSSVYAHIRGGFTSLVGDDYPFQAAEGINVTITDNGTEILCYVDEILVAKAVIEDSTLTVYNPEGEEINRTTDLSKVAHGDSLGYIRVMSHFADSTTHSMSLLTGDVEPYAPEDIVSELRDGYDYLLCNKTQILTDYPITIIDGVVLMDVKAAATLMGYKCAISEDGNTATLTREGVTLVYTVESTKVEVNGTTYECPTTVCRDGTVLIAVDYLARWMGYTVTLTDNSVYVTAAPLTEEMKQSADERYNLYADVVYNYDDVKIGQTGVGKYEATPYEDRLVGIAYSTWLCTKIIDWGKNTWDTPLYGNYYSDDREMIAKHAELLRDAGVDFVFIDWTNNTTYDPNTMRDSLSDFRMIEDATELVFEIWSQIEGAPKICIFVGPGHSGMENVDNGNHQKKVDQVYSSFVEKYPDMYFNYHGKPLLMCYGATPNQYTARPTWRDSRFTVRWVTGYVGQQTDLFDTRTMATRYNWWSWEERGLQTYSVDRGFVECVTVTASSRPQGSEGDSSYIPAYDRDNGATLKQQFQRANDLGAGLVILVSWNEWTTGEQPSAEGSKDLEPSVIHGTFYYDLLREQIKKFKGQITVE